MLIHKFIFCIFTLVSFFLYVAFISHKHFSRVAEKKKKYY